ncbi:LON peptidase substrate-binding domain-containing protein [Microcella sp.]|uniref:LON peptidase substrate-binding domain-containing protein n=1 Tax=Microcella sp. TaxID=1913979 RepID=UPI003918775C
MAVMPMFPLGSVLFPYMPTALRIFEERYIVMLSEILGDEPAEFGIVLIERGSEVGGGEQRFPVGTVARITQVQTSDGFIGLVAQGDRRIEVTAWRPDDPYPLADVRELPSVSVDDEVLPLMAEVEKVVRATIAQASEFMEVPWPADIQLDDDPRASIWQLAAIAPLGPLDQQKLLRSETAEQLLTATRELTLEAAEMLTLTSDWNDELP